MTLGVGSWRNGGFNRERVVSDNLEAGTPEDVVLPFGSGSGSGKGEAPLDFAEVLKQVISAAKTDAEGSAQDLALRRRLRDVAVRFSGQELTLNPVLVALVDVVNTRCGNLTADQRSKLNQAVARTVYDDTESRARLEQLWHSLGDSA